MIPFWRLAEVLKDPEDAEVITGFVVWRAAGPYRPQIDQDIVPPEEFMFWKNSTPEEDRGEPPLLATMKPVKWYADWLFNRVLLNRFRTSIVLFKKIIDGTPGKVSAVSSADPAAKLHQGTHGKLEKRLPKPGTVITHNDKIEYDFKSPQLDASDAGEDGRKILLYIACAAQVPEFILGDAKGINYNSIFVAENPFIRQIEAYQKYMESFFQDMFRRVIEHGIKTGKLPEMSTDTDVVERSRVSRAMFKLLRKLGLSEADENGNGKTSRTIPTRTDVAIDWPPLLHKNALEDAQVRQIDQAVGLASKQTLRGKAGYDHDTELERLSEEQAQDMDQFAAQRQAELDMAAAAAGGGDPEAPAKGVPKEPAEPGRTPGHGGDPSRQGYGKS